MTFRLNIEQLRKQAKERVRDRRAAGETIKLSEAQFELAREHGFASWPKLKAYVERLGFEQPFRTDIEYYEGRADGIATTGGVSVAEARRELARRHGFPSWSRLRSHVAALRSGEEPPTPFMLAYRAVEDERPRSARRASRPQPRAGRAARHQRQRPARHGRRPRARPAAARARRRSEPRQRLRLDEAAPGRLLQRPRARAAMLAAGGRTDLSARGDGGTPLVAALFWGHREVVDLLGREPRNLRVAAGLGDVELIRELAGTPAGGRPPRLLPSARRLPGVAALRRSAGDTRRGARLGGEGRPRRGDRRCSSSSARVSTPIRTAARRSPGRPRTAASPSIRQLVELGADPNQRATFGGPTTARASRPFISPRRPAGARPSRRCSSSAPTRRSATPSTTVPPRAGPRSETMPRSPSSCPLPKVCVLC